MHPFIGGDAWPYLTQITADLNGVGLGCGEVFARFNPDRFSLFPFASTFFSFFEPIVAYYLFLLLFYIIANVSFYLFSGLYTERKLIRFISAFTYSTSLVFLAIVYWGNPSTLIGFAYIPGIVYVAVKALDGRGQLNAAFALTGGIFTALVALGGGWYYVGYIAVIALVLVCLKWNVQNVLYSAFFAGMGFEFVAGSYVSGMVKHLDFFERIRSSYLPLNWFDSLTIWLYGRNFGSPLSVALPLITSPVLLAGAFYGFFNYKFDWRHYSLIVFLCTSLFPIPSIDTARALAPAFFIFCAFFVQALDGLYSSYRESFNAVVFFHLSFIVLVFSLFLFLAPQSDYYGGEALKVKNVVGNNYVWLGEKLESANRSLQFELVKLGVPLVNPYSSVQEKNNKTCSVFVLESVFPVMLRRVENNTFLYN